MKTVNEFYEEIKCDKKMWESFSKAVESDQAEAFMKAHGCDAAFTELTEYLQSMKKEKDDIEQLDLETLEKVAGGFPTYEDCLSNCFVSDVYVPWLDSFCPKCEFYFSTELRASADR